MKLGLRDYANIASVAAVLLALAFGILTAIQVRQATIYANRAWVHPMGLVVSAPDQSPLRIELQIRNTGSSPATKVRFLHEAEGWSDGEKAFAEAFDCRAPPDPRGPTLFPTGADTPTTGQVFLINDFPVDDPPAELAIRGCIVYETFGERHTSGFCFLALHEGQPAREDWTPDCLATADRFAD